MELTASIDIARPVATVWDFYAVNHVANHPRWDPSIELKATDDGPIGVGTVISRRVTRFGRTTEGTMEVVEFDPMRLMRVTTVDGPMRIDGWATMEPLDESTTRISIGGEFGDIDDAVAQQVVAMIERSTATIKELIEAET